MIYAKVIQNVSSFLFKFKNKEYIYENKCSKYINLSNDYFEFYHVVIRRYVMLYMSDEEKNSSK